MIVQQEDFIDQIQEAKRRGKAVAVGGPYPTALPKEAEAAGADYLILDEGEITLPLFVEAVRTRRTKGVFRSGGEKPDVSHTPIPRFDLLEFDAYSEMSSPVLSWVSLSVRILRHYCPLRSQTSDKNPSPTLAELERLMSWVGDVAFLW
jgi:radical SAM superfamily enzyme YgiQ (UPF0313 family)